MKKCKKGGGWVLFNLQSWIFGIVPTFHVGMHPKTLCVDFTTKKQLINLHKSSNIFMLLIEKLCGSLRVLSGSLRNIKNAKNRGDG